MELTSDQHYIVPKVACCMCGIVIDSNPSNMCGNCIRSHVDITEGLVKEYILVYCSECHRYLQPPKFYLRAELESRELMTICLKKIKGLAKYTLVDASFIWTEPHSKRLKLKITIQREIFANTVIQQSLQIDYEVVWQQCPTCAKAATGQPQWDAVVQLRQKVTHRRTFLYLEQLILKHKMHEDVTRIESQPDGMDFFYGHKSHALSFTDFVSALAPITRTVARQLVSHDSKSNTAVEHHTFSLEISPLCREDLVLLPKMYYTKLGGLGPVVLVHKVYSSIVFVDPSSLRAGDIMGTLYWKHPFNPIASSKELSEFYVIDIQPTGVINGKYNQAMATVCLSSEVGQGREWVVQTHLGNVLKIGDLCKGYYIAGLNVNDEQFDDMQDKLPDVVLVRKHFPAQVHRRSKRKWMLQRLDVMVGQAQNRKDREELQREEDEFEDEVERDAEFRKDIAVYKDHSKKVSDNNVAAPTAGGDADGEESYDDIPEVELAEMLDGLQINDDDAELTGLKRPREE